MREKDIFSDGQALGALNSTGVVCTNPFDMELDGAAGNVILTDDQIEAVLNVAVLSSTNAAGTQGMDVEIRSSDNNDMTTGAIVLASLHLTKAEIVAGTRKSIKVLASLTQKFLGVWYKATDTSLDNLTSVDCWLSAVPDGSPNEDIQKIPS